MSLDVDTVSNALADALTGPAAVSGDAGSVTARPIPDLIAAHKYLSGIAAASSRTRGLRFNRLVPDGTVSRRHYAYTESYPQWREV